MEIWTGLQFGPSSSIVLEQERFRPGAFNTTAHKKTLLLYWVGLDREAYQVHNNPEASLLLPMPEDRRLYSQKLRQKRRSCWPRSPKSQARNPGCAAISQHLQRAAWKELSHDMSREHDRNASQHWRGRRYCSQRRRRRLGD